MGFQIIKNIELKNEMCWRQKETLEQKFFKLAFIKSICWTIKKRWQKKNTINKNIIFGKIWYMRTMARKINPKNMEIASEVVYFHTYILETHEWNRKKVIPSWMIYHKKGSNDLCSSYDYFAKTEKTSISTPSV